MILADCLAESKPKDTWSRILKHMHGVLLGKKRVVYHVRQSAKNNEQEASWHSSINLVTAMSMTWVKETVSPGQTESTRAVAGRAQRVQGVGTIMTGMSGCGYLAQLINFLHIPDCHPES